MIRRFGAPTVMVLAAMEGVEVEMEVAVEADAAAGRLYEAGHDCRRLSIVTRALPGVYILRSRRGTCPAAVSTPC